MITINLLPVREERRKADLLQLGLTLVATLVLSLVLAAGFHWKLASDLGQARLEVTQAKRQIDRFGPQLKQVEEFRKVKGEIEKKLEVIEELDESRSGPVRVLDELASRIPERVWLTKLSAKDQKLTLDGLSLDNELVALFLTGLNDSPYFKDVELLETEAKQVDGYKLNSFEVSAVMTSPAAARREQEKKAKAAGGLVAAAQ